MYAQYVNSAYTVHNSKICLPKSTNAGKKKKKKAENVKMKTWTRYANGHFINQKKKGSFSLPLINFPRYFINLRRIDQ